MALLLQRAAYPFSRAIGRLAVSPFYHSSVGSRGNRSPDDLELGFSSANSRGKATSFSAFSLFLGTAAFYSAWQLQLTSEPAHSEEEKIALNPKEWLQFQLQQIERVSHNTRIFRFAFDPDETLGLEVASCLLTRVQMGTAADGRPNYVIRPYTPISDSDAKGYFDLMVKIYPEGKMSKYIGSLNPGDTLEVKGPISKFPYTPNMKKNIGMIAGGTGITPMLQVVNKILNAEDDYTKVSLIYANISPEDILLKEKLDGLAAGHPNFKVYYVVDNPTKDWKGGVGYISKDMILKGLPLPSNDTIILVCGPPGMMNHVSGDKAPDKSQGEVLGLLKEAGYTQDMVFKF
eukprot:c3901_g1_i1 orf=375-1412(-)